MMLLKIIQQNKNCKNYKSQVKAVIFMLFILHLLYFFLQTPVFLLFINKNHLIFMNLVILTTCNICDDLHTFMQYTAKWNEIK